MSVCSHHDTTREEPGTLYAVLYGEHALHQLSATRVWVGECVPDGSAFTAALNILQNDLKAWSVYAHRHCKTVSGLLYS